MAWTNEQLEAINKEGENIIVSAGAGSGKTAVLTERIFRKLKSNVDINSLLVLTFTKAAAKEMKERIRNKVLKDNSLEHVLKHIDTANITTFDAYSLSIVKKYFSKLNVNPNVTIADTVYINYIKDKYLNYIIDERFESNDINIQNFVSNNSVKNDNKLKEIVLKVYQSFDLYFNTLEKLDEFKKNKFEEEHLNFLINTYEKDVTKHINILTIKIDDCLSFCETSEKFNSYSLDLINSLNNINTYEEYFSIIDSIKFPSLSSSLSDAVKESRKQITEHIKYLNEEVFIYDSLEDIKNAILESKDEVCFIIDLVKELYTKMSAFKTSKNIYEFNDIAKLAIKLVMENPDVKDEIKFSTSEILVDEYQDTSDLQELFISLISNNNIYMVGDIKQSIYRFRNANPYIFKEKYDNYKQNIGGYKIDLINNFRSRSEVLDSINMIFNIIMTNSYGDADYISEHQMKFGFTKYNTDNSSNNQLEVLTYQTDELKPKLYSNAEIEAFTIAKDILSKVGKHTVYDKETDTFRKALFKDFCIIIDRNTQFDLFKKILEFNNIPVNIKADFTINQSDITSILLNILKLITYQYNNNYQTEYYHSLTSILRSFIYEYNDSTIYKIVKSNDLTNELTSYINSLVNLIDKVSVIDLFDKAIIDMNIYNNLHKIGDVNKSMIEIEFLRNIIKSISNSNNSIFDICDILDYSLKTDLQIKYNLEQNDSFGVKIMNIHKSKGLEFPVCYFSMLDVTYNKSEFNSTHAFYPEFGLCVPSYKNDLSSPIKFIGMEENIKKDISEKIRLFYVALTRTREKIIILRPEVEYKTEFLQIENNNSFSKLLFIVGEELAGYNKYIPFDIANLSKDYENSKEIKVNKTSNKLVDDVIKKEYKEEYNKNISKQVTTLLTSKEKTYLNTGIKYHEVLENINFKDIKYSLSILSDEYKDTMSKILNLDIFKDIEKAKVYKEHEFVYKNKDDNYHGIIDLLVEHEDKFLIIDYKLSNIDNDNYKKQLATYKEYVKSKSNKNVETYLLSILKCEVRKVD
ncbi:MAG: UvrD-helicase domain-containing protein [Anaeroplasmataceae bacterium]